MSSNVIVVDPQDIPGYVSSDIIIYYVDLAGQCWYIYECLLTLHLEVDLVWKSKISLTTILFLINRYTFIQSWGFHVVYAFFFANNTQICRTLDLLGSIGNILNISAISGIFILRTYAISAHNRWILLILIALFLVRLGLGIMNFSLSANEEVLILIPEVDSIGNCGDVSSLKPAAIELLLTVVFDATIFFVTLSRTWSLSRQAKSAGIQGGLGDLLLRDGSLYFGILFIATVLDATVVLDPTLPTLLVYCSGLASPLEVILTNRLVLNLRTHNTSNSSLDPSTKTDIFFRNAYGGMRNGGDRASFVDSVLGNIGAPLRVGDDDDHDGDDDDDNVAEEGERTQDTDREEIPMLRMEIGDEGTTRADGELV